ncbi:hypothetical protein GCM10007079_18890 [Nocardiopsis terrae]|uniref:Uncharacterized protein n=1 Tax=Nocardiopsis terrae TaxID=372655 RepID=A0ABR9HHK9_9ACTN|nr:hypothetical protein [Nocardiopsis terrae]MBE1458489.1 hypothetical protein [Nocardiopsis terrae]GHC80142.1 hypothetical protein GCM10007079_18890 [Nocardiopsis terrae]
MRTTSESPEPRESGGVGESAGISDTAPRLSGVVWVVVLPAVLALVVTLSVVLALLDVSHGGGGAGVLAAAGGFVLAGAVLCWFRWWMRRRGAARPGELPVVVSVAVVTGAGVGFLRFEWSVLERVAPLVLALGCVGLALAGAMVVWVMPPRRVRVVFASGLVLALGLALVGWSWLEKRADDERKNRELSERLAAVDYPVAVLDAPGWEPVAMEVGSQSGVLVTYSPLDQQLKGEGFTLKLRTEPVDPEDARWRPGWENCSEDGGSLPCEGHGAVVLVDQTERYTPYMNARVELVEGVVASLWTDVPGDFEGRPLMGMPDVDMVELAEQISPLEGVEAQRMVEELR